MRLDPRTVDLMHYGVADQPLVLDRILVDQHDHHGAAVRDGDETRVVVRVADPNLDSGRRRQRRVNG